MLPVFIFYSFNTKPCELHNLVFPIRHYRENYQTRLFGTVISCIAVLVGQRTNLFLAWAVSRSLLAWGYLTITAKELLWGIWHTLPIRMSRSSTRM